MSKKSQKRAAAPAGIARQAGAIDLQLRQIAEENLRWKMLLAVWCRREGKPIMVSRDEIAAVLGTKGLEVETVADPIDGTWLLRIPKPDESGPPRPPESRLVVPK